VVVLWAGGGNSCPFVSKRLHWPSVKKVEVCTGGLYSDGLCEDIPDTLDDAVTDQVMAA
jgi:hypothetical protein